MWHSTINSQHLTNIENALKKGGLAMLCSTLTLISSMQHHIARISAQIPNSPLSSSVSKPGRLGKPIATEGTAPTTSGMFNWMIPNYCREANPLISAHPLFLGAFYKSRSSQEQWVASLACNHLEGSFAFFFPRWWFHRISILVWPTATSLWTFAAQATNHSPSKHLAATCAVNPHWFDSVSRKL